MLRLVALEVQDNNEKYYPAGIVNEMHPPRKQQSFSVQDHFNDRLPGVTLRLLCSFASCIMLESTAFALMLLVRFFDHGMMIIPVGKMNQSLIGEWLMLLVYYSKP